MSSASYDEIVAATYAGWVVGLNSEPQQKEAGPSVGAQEPISEEVQAKMDNLRCDIHWFDDIMILTSYLWFRSRVHLTILTVPQTANSFLDHTVVTCPFWISFPND